MRKRAKLHSYREFHVEDIGHAGDGQEGQRRQQHMVPGIGAADQMGEEDRGDNETVLDPLLRAQEAQDGMHEKLPPGCVFYFVMASFLLLNPL